MSHVKVILQEDVQNLGEAGELVSVKPGHARNYLLPKGKALSATDSRLKELEHKKIIGYKCKCGKIPYTKPFYTNKKWLTKNQKTQ